MYISTQITMTKFTSSNAYVSISILTLFLWERFHTTLALHSGVEESVYLVCDVHHITLPASDNEKNNIDC